jgi:predicted aspartyl protease
VIVGVVNAKLELTLPLQIEDVKGHLHPIEVVIDTGFTAALTLRPSQLKALSLPRARKGLLQLGDGTVQWFDVHDALLEWDGYPIQVAVYAMDITPLLGTHPLAGHDLTARFVPGGAVNIAPVP